MLEMKNISRSYGESGQKRLVINHLNLMVGDRDFYVIVGPSGCGKSTLLRLAGGFDRPDGGEVLLDGRKVTGPSKEIMMVFQSFDQLFPWYTLLNNLTYAMKKTRLPFNAGERRERAKRYLDMAGLAGFEDRYPHELSGGMKQRGALARALCLEPKLLLMDEPFSSLDVRTKKGLYPAVADMASKTGCAVLLVTHDIREAIRLGSTVAVMSEPRKGISEIFPQGCELTEDRLEAALEAAAEPVTEQR